MDTCDLMTLGAEIEYETFDGMQKLKFLQFADSDRFRYGFRVPRLQRREGDLIVEIVIDTPPNLSEVSKRLMIELAEVETLKEAKVERVNGMSRALGGLHSRSLHIVLEDLDSPTLEERKCITCRLLGDYGRVVIAATDGRGS